MRQRVLVVGWDGADWEIVEDLLARGLLPHLRAMLDEGGRGTLLSTIPSHSWSAWSSFLTGFQPAGAVVAVGSTVGEVSAQEQDEISQHLRDLGYIE